MKTTIALVLILLGSIASIHAATFVVTTTGDEPDANLNDTICDVDLITAGEQCTLRAAIQQPGNLPQIKQINFNIPGAGTRTIQLSSSLPVVNNTRINGYTQPGASPNTFAVGNDAVLRIEVRGGLTTSIGSSVDTNTISGLLINGSVVGIRINGTNSSFNHVTGCWFGLNADGSASALPNGTNILTSLSAAIGSTLPADRNVISNATGNGILVQSPTNTSVVNNYIGTDPTGTQPRANAQNGITGTLTSSTVLLDIQNNLIAGNDVGVSVAGMPDRTGVQLSGNKIGTTANGLAALPNRIGATVSGKVTLLNNRIAFNTAKGVVNSGGAGVKLTRNSFFSNGLIGIDIGNNGVSPNVPFRLQNFPIITTVTSMGGMTRIRGTFSGGAGSGSSTRNYTFEFYNSAAASTTGFGEGDVFIGSTILPTDNIGNASFDVTFNYNASAGSFITATATLLADEFVKGTSEFSQAVQILPPTAEPFIGISGRIVSASERGIANARLQLIDARGQVRPVMTNPFGYYRFAGVPNGRVYVVSVSSKTYSFGNESQTVLANTEVNNLNFTANR